MQIAQYVFAEFANIGRKQINCANLLLILRMKEAKKMKDTQEREILDILRSRKRAKG